MKWIHRVVAFLVAVVSFFTTVLCMKDVLAVREEMQATENAKK